ncbi:plasmid pRiA4b ORF-3 family protein [Novosphingobium jiangmenense]|uniref:Plasmid pRiA4b ORF-3 family protein n=1 Tax=Novosphingobium jiangmenense TaxID=2791981 RepID=A0ABS0HIR6_9SPHN|nr:plasmid pRiA4b ORF-3 family protein [Novosphingobium jiangmenense]MBF9152144.1 plasmid pRiA4b ORF-3 family protein [Novosphingobium jiangmenense]
MTETVARLHIALPDTDPLIWRRVDMPVDASLKMLHDVIQGAMGWLDYHLWEFEADDKRYGLPDPDWEDDSLFAAKNIKLKTLLDRGVRQLLYTYDMGDNWEHVVTVEAIEDGQPGAKYPRYIDGERRAPPEDVGGMPGFEAFLDTIAKPRGRDHKDAVQWHRGCYGKDFDPEEIEELAAKLRIGDIAKRRAAGKASFAKRKSP